MKIRSRLVSTIIYSLLFFFVYSQTAFSGGRSQRNNPVPSPSAGDCIPSVIGHTNQDPNLPIFALAVTVTDLETGKPIQGVSVRSSSVVIFTLCTNSLGFASRDTLPRDRGPYTIGFSKQGYQNEFATVRPMSAIETIDIKLKHQ